MKEYVAKDLDITKPIPRNKYGNFELLHANFLPTNCVHLVRESIGATAKKLGVPYAPAMVRYCS